jgi:alpha-galactosidase
MGWNSWDAYGLTIDEAQFRANVDVLASLKQYGWQYAVIDEGWYMQDPFASGREKQKYVFDANGRLIPALNRFPSSSGNSSLKPIADWVHSKGLKFGIHLIRGIPKESVQRNTPIAGSSFTAKQAADTSDLCPWDEGNYGVQDNAAGQAWYDSMVGLYASWGVDFFKVDCISDHTYKASEIRQLHRAIVKSGRPIVLSLSPGPAAIDHVNVFAPNSQMWRISDDHWDVWADDRKSKNGTGEFPFTTRDAFDRLAKWNKYAKPGNWPDEDMLPFGSLTPHPGWENARESRLTHDEERTEFTLWAIARSPLILGANLTKLDDFTRSLITNKELIAINQATDQNQPIEKLPAGFEHIRAWKATKARWKGNAPIYLALFNLGDQPAKLHFTWAELGFEGKEAKNLFGDGKSSSNDVSLTLPPHASTVYSGLTLLGSRAK